MSKTLQQASGGGGGGLWPISSIDVKKRSRNIYLLSCELGFWSSKKSEFQVANFLKFSDFFDIFVNSDLKKIRIASCEFGFQSSKI